MTTPIEALAKVKEALHEANQWCDGSSQFKNAMKLQDEALSLLPILKAALAMRIAGGWLPIEGCPVNETVLFTSHIVPSAEAARNGSPAMWVYGTGSKIVTAGRNNYTIYTGILGGEPSHYKLLTPPAQEKSES